MSSKQFLFTDLCDDVSGDICDVRFKILLLGVNIGLTLGLFFFGGGPNISICHVINISERIAICFTPINVC